MDKIKYILVSAGVLLVGIVAFILRQRSKKIAVLGYQLKSEQASRKIDQLRTQLGSVDEKIKSGKTDLKSKKQELSNELAIHKNTKEKYDAAFLQSSAILDRGLARPRSK